MNNTLLNTLTQPPYSFTTPIRSSDQDQIITVEARLLDGSTVVINRHITVIPKETQPEPNPEGNQFSVNLQLPTVIDTLAGNTIMLSAEVTNGEAAYVDFFIDGELVHRLSEAPYEFSWTAQEAKNYQFHAQAVNRNSGEITSSLISTIAAIHPSQLAYCQELTNWSAGTSYAVNSYVQHNGQFYLSFIEGSTTAPDQDNGQWGLVACADITQALLPQMMINQWAIPSLINTGDIVPLQVSFSNAMRPDERIKIETVTLEREGGEVLQTLTEAPFNFEHTYVGPASENIVLHAVNTLGMSIKQVQTLQGNIAPEGEIGFEQGINTQLQANIETLIKVATWDLDGQPVSVDFYLDGQYMLTQYPNSFASFARPAMVGMVTHPKAGSTEVKAVITDNNGGIRTLTKTLIAH